MSGIVDVGDAIELTFSTATGATVSTSWLDPDQNADVDDVAVTETPSGSGQFPYTFVPTAAGWWTAVFTSSGTATAVERYYVRATAPAALPPLASVGDVAAQFGVLTAAQEKLTAHLVRAASRLVRARFPTLDAQLAAGLLDPEVIALAVANMVLRVLRNPSGLRAETIGPFSRTYDVTHAAGLLIITELEFGMFVPTPTVTTPLWAVGTIRMVPGMVPEPGFCRGRW